MKAVFRYAAPATLLAAAFVVKVGPTIGAQGAPQQTPPPAGAQAPPPGQGPGGQAAPGGAPGRGRGNPAATLFTEQCAGCHGSDAAGGRAPSLFDQKWLGSVDDARIVNSIKNGVKGTEMEGFGQALNDGQIWSLVQYIRTQTGNLTPKPEYVADPAALVIKSEKQAFKLEVLNKDVNTPFGMAFLPDG